MVKIELVNLVKMEHWENTHKEIGELFLQHELLRIQRLRELQSKKLDIDKQYYFLTVNPKPTIGLRDFIKTVEKALSKKWLNYCIYVYEQRGECEAELGKGFHTHIIFKKNLSHTHTLREMKNSFKNMCDTDNYHVYNIKNIGEEEKLRKIQYILDKKADNNKHLKQDMDIIWRQKEKLKSHYIIEQ